MLLVDAGVWVASGTPSERYFSVSREILRDRRNAIAALDLTLYEVTNAVAAKLAQPAQAMTLTTAILTRCVDERLVRVDGEMIDTAVAIAAEQRITVYDAAYVAAARRHGWALVSTDVRDLVSKGLAVAPDAALYP
ncbi:MAG: PIN domain-containing protein [Solirubrobacterales bacterium]